MPKVYAKDNESIESLIERFTRSVKKNETIEDFKKNQEFISKPKKRKNKSIKARMRDQKKGNKK